MDNGNDDDDMDSDMDHDEAGDTYDVVDAVGRVEGGVSRVESAVARVEQAVKEKWSWIGWMLIMVLLWNVPGDIWHAKWRYAISYGVGSDKVIVDKRPHDCAFITAPLGEKYCHYDRGVSTIRWATSQSGNAIASWDEGKTWTAFTPEAGVAVPKYDTVQQVFIGWKRVEE